MKLVKQHTTWGDLNEYVQDSRIYIREGLRNRSSLYAILASFYSLPSLSF